MASSDEESEAEVQAATKKRKGNPKLWKISVAKKKRDSGEAYVSAYTNKQMRLGQVYKMLKSLKSRRTIRWEFV